MILEWLSFILSPYISPYLFTWYRDEISFPYKSFRNEFIPVFNPNEILVLVRHFILASCKLKTNSVLRWNRKPYSQGRVAHSYRFQEGRQNGRFQDGRARRFCHMNAVRTSFWNETDSGIMWTAPKTKGPITWAGLARLAGLARCTEMTAQPGITWGGPARLQLNLELSCENMATSKSMNRVLLLSLIHYFGVLFSVLRSFMVW